jgi:hypothetical protein
LVFKWKINCIYDVDNFVLYKINIILDEIIFENENNKKKYKKVSEKIRKIFNCENYNNNFENEKISTFWFYSSNEN